jgi:glycosyltransferase involved in cell wall biosynthesis
MDYFDKKSGTTTHLVPNLKVTGVSEYCPRGTNVPLDVFAQDSAFYIIQHYQPDIVMPINDVWALYSFNFLRNRKNFYFMPYLAVDSECFPLEINTQKPGLPPIDTIRFLGATNKTVVFTDFARETINVTTRIALGGKVPNNMDVIPHGVDTAMFRPLEGRRDELRERFFGIKPEDKVFVIGCVQRNQPRKRMDAMFQTLRIFIDKYEQPNKKAVIHFHCAMKDNLGWDLPWLARYYGVVDRCIFDNKLAPGFGVPGDVLNEIFNSYDVHMTLTNSEGWGLPILETMAAGVPNIITDYSAHGDWATDTALKVKLSAKIHEVKTNHIKGIADIEHAAKQLSLLYNSDKMIREYQRKSLKLAKELDWKNVCDKWRNLINDIDVSHFEDNRYDVSTIKPETIQDIPSNPVTTEFELVEV